MVHDSMTDAPRRSAGQGYEVPQPLARLTAALEDFDVYLHQITQQWPKADRHGLSARCRDAAMSFLAVMRHANAAVTTRQMLNRFMLRGLPC